MKEIIFKRVSKIFGENVGLEDVSFEIEKGDFVFITGRDGAGKSTLLKLLSRQLLPGTGEIWITGREVRAVRSKEIPFFMRQFGVIQEETGLLRDRTVFQNMEFTMKAVEQPKELIEERISEILRAAGVTHTADFYPEQLPAGDRVFVLLARALLLNPDILVADEPTKELNADEAWDFMCLLDELNRIGTTVILTTRDRELVSIMKKRVITLIAGRKAADEKSAVYNMLAEDIFEERRILNERAQNEKL